MPNPSNLPPVPKVTEAKIEAKLVKWCRAHGIYNRKFSSPSNSGVPDRIFIHGGVVLFVELKRPGNTTTALQKKEIQDIINAGGTALVATGYEEAERIVVTHYMLKIAEKTKQAAKTRAKPAPVSEETVDRVMLMI